MEAVEASTRATEKIIVKIKPLGARMAERSATEPKKRILREQIIGNLVTFCALAATSTDTTGLIVLIIWAAFVSASRGDFQASELVR